MKAKSTKGTSLEGIRSARQRNEGLHEICKAPMAGFFTYGEYGISDHGKHQFHSATWNRVALKKK